MLATLYKTQHQTHCGENMRRASQRFIQQRCDGFTLVEMLVGVIIGLIGTLIIFQVFAVSEAQKRTTTSGGDAQQNGNFALYRLEQDIRNAGSGLADITATVPRALNCSVRAYNSGATPSPNITPFPLVPVLIADGGGATPDQVTVMYGMASNMATPVRFSTAPNPSTAAYSLFSARGFQQGNVVLIVEGDSTVTPYPECVMAQASATPGVGVNTLNHASGALFPFNNPAAVPVTYTATSYLFNLGIPVVNRYFIRVTAAGNGSDLIVNPVLSGTNRENPIVTNVVNLQAQYGVDTDDDDVVDSWENATAVSGWNRASLDADKVTQIKAIRIAVVTRSSLQEQQTVSPAVFTLLREDAVGATAKPITINLTAAEQRFRYEVFETIIPLRNVLWQSNNP